MVVEMKSFWSDIKINRGIADWLFWWIKFCKKLSFEIKYWTNKIKWFLKFCKCKPFFNVKISNSVWQGTNLTSKIKKKCTRPKIDSNKSAVYMQKNENYVKIAKIGNGKANWNVQKVINQLKTTNNPIQFSK